MSEWHDPVREDLDREQARGEAAHSAQQPPSDHPFGDDVGTVPDGKSAPRRKAQVIWGNEVVMKIARLLTEHVPAGELTVMAGREGTGKSSRAIALAAGVTRGTLEGSLFGQPRRVLYLAREDSWSHTIAPRLVAAGADMRLVGHMDVLPDGDPKRVEALTLPDDTGLIEAQIVKHKIALVVFDPIVSTMGEALDGNKQKDTRIAYEPLIAVAHKHETTLVGIAHFTKAQADPITLISGSHALKDMARSVVVFAHDSTAPDGERVMQQVKNSLGKLDSRPHRYRIDSATVVTADGPTEVGIFRLSGEVSDRSVAEVLAGNSRPADADGEGAEVAAWLHDQLVGRPGCEAPAKTLLDLGRGAGYTVDQVKRAKSKIDGFTVRSVKATGTTHGAWVWRMEPKP